VGRKKSQSGEGKVSNIFKWKEKVPSIYSALGKKKGRIAKKKKLGVNLWHRGGEVMGGSVAA